MDLIEIYKKLGDDLNLWLKDVTNFFERLSKKLTASVSWDFINKQVRRKIEAWYLLIQNAVDDTEVYLQDENIDGITPEVQKWIRSTFEIRLKEYQSAGKEFLTKYESVLNKIDPEILVELKDIIFEITVENILNILKEMFNEGE